MITQEQFSKDDRFFVNAKDTARIFKTDIYKYKIENGKYLFAPEEDKEKYSYILADLVTDEVIGQAENKSDNE